MSTDVAEQLNTVKHLRCKTLDPSNWVADLKPGRVMDNDEIPSSEVDFVDAQLLDKVANRFAAHGKTGTMKQLLKRALKALNIVHRGFSESKPIELASIIDGLKATIDNWTDEPVCYRVKFICEGKPDKSWIHESSLGYIRDLRSSGRPCIIEELYTHSNVVVRLTDAEIDKVLMASINVEGYHMLPFAFVREIEKRILGGVND